MTSRDVQSRGGVLTISLDFELYWGWSDRIRLDAIRRRLLGTREVIPRILDLFATYEVHATWATVGFLTFSTRDELLSALPERRPSYAKAEISPYRLLDELGVDEQSDPFHFAGSLVRGIAATPGQELATHTFSHYYCLEPGQDAASFEADLGAATAAGERIGARPRSIVFPRNQCNLDYLGICQRAGIVAYRGTQGSWLYAPRADASESLVRRGFRLADAYAPVSSHHAHRLTPPAGLPMNLPASRFLRPYSPRLAPGERLRLRRILSGLEHAARHGLGYHLWWHPEDFGLHQGENLSNLERILARFAVLRDRRGMRSLSMAEVADEAVAASPAPHSGGVS